MGGLIAILRLLSFSTVYQSYQDDRRVIIKCCVQWNPVEKISTYSRNRTRTVSSAGQRIVGLNNIYSI